MSLARTVLGLAGDGCLEQELTRDPGTRILRRLIEGFRYSRLARAMTYTLRFLRQSRGVDALRALLQGYFAQTYPDLSTAPECDRFASYLLRCEPEAREDGVLAQVLAFEHALVRASMTPATSVEITWRLDPVEVLESLEGGRSPRGLQIPPLRMLLGGLEQVAIEAKIPAVPQPQDQTDRRDARALCDACHMGTYRPSHRANDESRLLRKHLAARAVLVQMRSRTISLCRSLLRQDGFRVPSGSALSFPKRVRLLELGDVLSTAVSCD